MSQYNQLYRQLLIEIFTRGTKQEGRNGNTIVIPSYSFTIDDMANDHTMLLRKMYTKGIIGEFLTITDPKPLTNVRQFVLNSCPYWSNWADQEDGSLRLDYHDELMKQLPDVIEGIKNDPNGRRHVISLWNHTNVTTGVLSLPCCWWGMTFSVIDDTLHLTWGQRSVDTAVGLPSDVYLAYLFMNMVAEQTNLKIGSCMFSLSNVHLYEEHLDNAHELLTRTEEDYNRPLSFELKS